MIIKVTKTLILNLFYDKVEANRIYFTNSFSSDYIPQKKVMELILSSHRDNKDGDGGIGDKEFVIILPARRFRQ